MSMDYWAGGMYGIKLDTIITDKELISEMINAYDAADRQDEDLIIEDVDFDEKTIYLPRYRKILAKKTLAEFEDYPGKFVELAFKDVLLQHVPGYRKVTRHSHIFRVPQDAYCDFDPDDTLLYGVGVYALPLEKNSRRAKLPPEFCAKADMHLWVTGG